MGTLKPLKGASLAQQALTSGLRSEPGTSFSNLSWFTAFSNFPIFVNLPCCFQKVEAFSFVAAHDWSLELSFKGDLPCFVCGRG